MSPLNKQQLEQIRDERKEQIKQAALKVFATRGFAGTKTSTIASAAGISEGLIYRYFKSKDELFTEIVVELMEEAGKEIGHIQLSSQPPSDLIRTLTESMLEENNKYAFRLILQARKAEKVPEQVGHILERYAESNLIERLVPVIVKGQQAGQFFEGDPRQLLSWYFSVVNSLILQELGTEEYGMPSADVLMRILAR
ncbi:TetR/AcrR family transcriptional regulator [Paenibacillus piri]|uniref:TetR/AcrR family transcriptional regulator n=1 Tax=Paenibacillus piri TaxID=2547395 RepID=A0A4R5KHZ5_9BACL|nr:TetR/AcrR family transcriptional regulator [Paenibacillus piri]TDF94692.1 TetR/AcrR family transcriptional regulator [Paenibacillus piri]